MAREALAPAGLIQKGRSRTWFADHGYWIALVEFQPSSWARGSYLNSGGCFLWQGDNGDPFLAFEFRPNRAETLVRYESDEQFEAEAHRLAVSALREVEALREALPSLEVCAERLGAGGRHELKISAGIANGLVGRRAEALRLLEEFISTSQRSSYRTEVNEQGENKARVLCQRLEAGEDVFRRHVAESIRPVRERLKLDPDAFSLASDGAGLCA